MALRLADVVGRLSSDEPHSSLALGALLGVARPRLECRLLSAGPGARSLCPVVRTEPGVWLAYPVLGHPDDAAELGHAVDRSPALAVQGPTGDVEPLVPHLRRVVEERTLRRIIVPTPIEWEPPSAATRLAGVVDLDALLDLYEGYELPVGRTRRAMVRFLRDAVERRWVMVADGDDAGLDAAIIAVARTPRFVEWSALTVRPEARGRRLSWALVSRCVAMANATGLGFVAIMGPRNPMTLPDWLGAIDAVTEVDLWLPDRVRGERRLRRLWTEVDTTRRRRP
jgi:GNAT superfamily N-acetyltransferase